MGFVVVVSLGRLLCYLLLVIFGLWFLIVCGVCVGSLFELCLWVIVLLFWCFGWCLSCCVGYFGLSYSV